MRCGYYDYSKGMMLKEKLKSIERVPLGQWPTPVTRARHLGRAYGLDSLWIKRDDASAPVVGGSKVRKLEYLLAPDPEIIVTTGGTGSNHVLATAYYGIKTGTRTCAVLARQPVDEHSERMHGLIRKWCEETVAVNTWTAVAPAAAKMLLRYPGCMFVPPGGTTPPGMTGAVRGALELSEQVESGLLPEPSWIVVAAGSGGTAAGLLLGLAVSGMKTRILAVRASAFASGNSVTIAALARRTAGFYGFDMAGEVRADMVRVVHDQIGRGYGYPTPQAQKALEITRDLEGIPLDPVYTAKAMAGLEAAAGSLDGTVVFWNTYAAPSLT